VLTKTGNSIFLQPVMLAFKGNSHLGLMIYPSNY